MIHIGDRFSPKETQDRWDYSWDYVTVTAIGPARHINSDCLHVFYKYAYRDRSWGGASWGGASWSAPVEQFERMTKAWEPDKQTLLRRYIKIMHE